MLQKLNSALKTILSEKFRFISDSKKVYSLKGIALISAGAGVDVLMVVSAQRACKQGRGGFSWQSARFAEEMGSSLSAESTRPRHARALHHAELRRTVFPPSISVVLEFHSYKPSRIEH